jgi:hypothetical protein
MHALAVRVRPLLIAMGLLAAGSARADAVNYSYHWGVSPSPAVFSSGGSIVALAVPPDGSTSAPAGALNQLPGATFSTNSSTSTQGQADSFRVPYQLTLHLTDTQSGAGHDFTFAGSLAGQVSANSSQLTSTLNTPSTRSFTLGKSVYAVAISPTLISIPAPGVTPAASLNALVKVAPVRGAPAINNTPEPSSLFLAGLALPLLGVRAWRRKGPRPPRGLS